MITEENDMKLVASAVADVQRKMHEGGYKTAAAMLNPLLRELDVLAEKPRASAPQSIIGRTSAMWTKEGDPDIDEVGPDLARAGIRIDFEDEEEFARFIRAGSLPIYCGVVVSPLPAEAPESTIDRPLGRLE